MTSAPVAAMTLPVTPTLAPADGPPSCSHICNFTRPDFCDSFLNGLSFLHCSSDECVENLCADAQDCEMEFQAMPEREGYCPMVFDGWSCVNATPAGSQAVLKCPDFQHLNFHNKNLAFRECHEDGFWHDTELSKPFTRYGGCLDVDTFQWYDAIIKIYITGYSVSLLFLLVATFIFLYFRSLRCVRNTIHTNLFIASILHNAAWIVWYTAVVFRMGSYKEWSEAEVMGCKVLNTIIQYFMVCTYFWTLCEGVYLFVVLIVTFVSESRVLAGLSTLGWVVPFILVSLYAICRSQSSVQGHHEICWMEETTFNWIYKGPCIVTIFLNFGFLLRIVHVLVSKLHSDLSDRAALIKTARAIGVLVPLFGLHNLIGAFKHDDGDSVWRIMVEIMSAITISFQGMVVAILFCLINNEVCFQLKKFFGDRLDSTRHQSMAMTQYTGMTTRCSSHMPSPNSNIAALRAEFNHNAQFPGVRTLGVSGGGGLTVPIDGCGDSGSRSSLLGMLDKEEHV